MTRSHKCFLSTLCLACQGYGNSCKDWAPGGVSGQWVCVSVFVLGFKSVCCISLEVRNLKWHLHSYADTHSFPVADVLLPLLTLLSELPHWTPALWWPPFLWWLVVSQTIFKAVIMLTLISSHSLVVFFNLHFSRNADTLGSFWRNWNVPFQKWIQRYRHPNEQHIHCFSHAKNWANDLPLFFSSSPCFFLPLLSF